MKQQPAITRQAMGCGYLPASDRARAWDGTSLGRIVGADERDENGKLHLPVCPGYACSLPEVIETTWAHSYWEKGELAQFCEGQSTPALRDAMGEYAIECSRAESWALKNPEKKS